MTLQELYDATGGDYAQALRILRMYRLREVEATYQRTAEGIRQYEEG